MPAAAESNTIDTNALFGPKGYATRIIRYHARRLLRLKVIDNSEVEDIEQELNLRLWKRLQTFDPERAKLNTFVSNSVGYAAREIKRLRCGEESRRQRKTRSLEVTISSAAQKSLSLEHLVTRSQQVRGCGRSTDDEYEQLDLQADVASVVASLPPRLQRACEKLLKARTPTAARKSVTGRKLAAIRARFEKAGLQLYV